MKKILFALAMLPLFAFVGCSSDDDDDMTPGGADFDYEIGLLYGEWRATGVELGPLSIDLTDPNYEVMVAPTYITFKEGGVYVSEGILGEGTGKFTTKDKTISTSLGGDEFSFEVKSLDAKIAKIELNAKTLGLSIIPEGLETVIVELTKNHSRDINFDYDVELLYGEWQATGVELGGVEINIKEIIEPTFVTFEKKGVYSSKGILGEGTGRYATKDKLIVTALNGEIVSFEMKEMNAQTAKIEIDAKTLDLPIIPEGIEEVIVVLTKQMKE